jgi:hypothetical protein
MAMTRSIAGFLFLAVVPIDAGATTIVMRGDDDLVRRSALIVTGNVLNVRTESKPNWLQTVASVRIDEVLKGAASRGTALRVVAPRGSDGHRAMIVAGAAVYRKHEDVLLFLIRHRNEWTTIDLSAGKFTRTRTETGDRYVRLFDGSAETPSSAHYANDLRPADEFIKAIRSAVGSNRPIRVNTMPAPAYKLPPIANSGPFPPSSYLTAPVSVNGVDHAARWPGFPGNGLQFVVSPPSGGEALITAAAEHWTAECGSGPIIRYTGTTMTPQCLAANGGNGVGFEDPCNEIPGTATSGVLAMTSVWVGPTTNTIGGETFWDITEAHVVVNEGFIQWGGSNDTGMEAIQHQLGHALGLRDADFAPDGSPCSAASDCGGPTGEIMGSAMHFAATAFNLGATGVGDWDARALRAVYPGGTCTRPFQFETDNTSAGLVYHDPNSGVVNVVNMFATDVQYAVPLAQSRPVETIVGIADFDGDGVSDILWTNGSGAYGIWLLTGDTASRPRIKASGYVQNAPPGVVVAGLGDFNGDGKADILWRDSSGGVGIWFMDGLSIASSGFVGDSPPSATIAGVGDFDADGKADILWRDLLGGVGIWFMDGLTIRSSAFVGDSPLATQIAGVGDFNFDGRSDILWRDSMGGVGVWFLNGKDIVDSQFLGDSNSTDQLIHVAFHAYAGTGAAPYNHPETPPSSLLWRSASGAIFYWYTGYEPIYFGPYKLLFGSSPMVNAFSPRPQYFVPLTNLVY